MMPMTTTPATTAATITATWLAGSCVAPRTSLPSLESAVGREVNCSCETARPVVATERPPLEKGGHDTAVVLSGDGDCKLGVGGTVVSPDAVDGDVPLVLIINAVVSAFVAFEVGFGAVLAELATARFVVSGVAPVVSTV